VAESTLAPPPPALAPKPEGGPLVRFALSRRGAITAYVLIVLVGWQIFASLVTTKLFPMPLDVASFMWDEVRGDTLAPATVYEAFATTLGRLLTGFAFAIVIGSVIGLLMGLSKRAEAFFRDFVMTLLAMPDLVWALVFAMWLGFGPLATIYTVTLAAMPFVILNVWEGVKSVPRDLVDMGHAYGVDRKTIIRHFIIPAQMPFAFAALRYGYVNGWKGVVVAEVFGAADGAGWTIRFWYDAHRSYAVVGYALFFVLFAIVLDRLVFRKLSNYVFRWRPSVATQRPNI
jgi:ABC-type nitrate/sulfonate/bicarbonate transport system permease component